MSRHLICLTIDTDPDNLNAPTPDRQTLAWDGLRFAISEFHAALPHIPLTWYVRADGQLEAAYGTPRHLLNEHRAFWQIAVSRGDELGWHPHLYTLPDDDTGDHTLHIIRDADRAAAELRRIHAAIEGSPFELLSFRMGEAWHTPQTLNTVEALGYIIDSSAIPGRDDRASGHPRNWSGAPNEPYFPAADAVQQAGDPRPLLEVPMTTWRFQASYDDAPKLRYMNPCIHPDLWQQALASWQIPPGRDLHLWILILHPAEAMPHDDLDLLYAYSLDDMRANLKAFTDHIAAQGDSYEFTTIARAAAAWRSPR